MTLHNPRPLLSLAGASEPQVDSICFSLSKLTLLAFGFLASQEVKDAKVGNLGLWDRERSDSQHNQPCNIWLYRASGTSLDTKVYSRIWWRSVESDDVSVKWPLNAESADIFQLG